MAMNSQTISAPRNLSELLVMRVGDVQLYQHAMRCDSNPELWEKLNEQYGLVKDAKLHFNESEKELRNKLKTCVTSRVKKMMTEISERSAERVKQGGKPIPFKIYDDTRVINRIDYDALFDFIDDAKS